MCSPDPDSIVAENDLAVAARDAFPVSPGHTLVMTKRHAQTWFDATKEERLPRGRRGA
jgi:diadenosine tetraphosphate (Ap4A) HIT family hydrolase